MKQKGFTLIELLAVIVILAIILAIAVPTITSIISNSTKDSFKSDAKLVIEGINNGLLRNDNLDVSTISFNSQNSANRSAFESAVGISTVNYKSIKITKNNGTITVSIVGQNKWDGLVASGTRQNMTVQNLDGATIGNIPTISLKGSATISIAQNSTYTDAGATATDTEDGDISSSIVITSDINTSVVGVYHVYYDVTDSDNNNATEALRTVNVTDNTIPTVAFGTNGNSTYAKSRNTTVTVSDNDIVDTSSLKYQWTTSTTVPTEASFTTSFTNGDAISTPGGVTGSYYLWILAKDKTGNKAIISSNVFNLDNTIPVITMSGSSPVSISVGSTYTDAGATATDNIGGNITSSITTTSTVNVNTAGTYYIYYNVSDGSGNAATQVVRTINVSANYTDGSGANAPVLFNNMIPVKYNGTNWVYADITQAWYNYTNKQWANAIVLVSSPSKSYNVGDTILMSDISQMYVWIPRYKYTIFNGNNGSVTAQQVNVVFESGTASTGTVSCTNAVAGSGSTSETCSTITNGTSTYTHPAFTFGAVALKGFWVGKFTTSNVTACTSDSGSVGTGCDLTTLGIQIKPNVTVWGGARISTFFTAIANVASTYSINADTHMMKNMEWGAVAYLEASKYGLGTTDIGINNNAFLTTGCGAASGSSYAMTCNAYNTANGMLASTTGNIYGIYDMSGGAIQYVMGNMVTSTNVPMVGTDSTYNSGFTGKLSGGTTFTGRSFPASKYYDAYTYDGTSYTTFSRSKLGDATKEALTVTGSAPVGLYSDDMGLVYSNYPWIVRGGHYAMGPDAGIFAVSYIDGSANGPIGARVSIVSTN